jgi:cytochrome c oxidase assembly factor CtaG
VRAGDRDALLRRYRRLAAGCWWLIAFSGLIDAAVLAPGRTVFTTGYGLVLLTKVALLIVVGILLTRARRAVAARSTTVWLGAELVALVIAFGLSVVLTDLPAPKFLGIPVTGDDTLLGYNLTAAPTFARLVGDWRIEIVFAPLCLILAVTYLAGIRRLRRSGMPWPVGRTGAWLGGCLVLLMATSSGLGRYAPAMFSIQAATHMLIGMLAPILFALGAPLTLAAAALRPADDGLPGSAEWLAAAGTSAAVRAGTHPLWCSAVFVGAPFLLYFTPVFDLTVRFHWAHLAMDVLFLVIGYLFAWMIIGVDPPPRPVSNLMRIGLLLAVMPADILFAGAILGSRRLIGDGNAGANMYTALALPWVHGLAADQRLGAYLALAISEICVLLILVVLVVRWRPAERDSDEADFRPLIEALRRRDQDRGLTVTEGAQPQAVGDHQQ